MKLMFFGKQTNSRMSPNYQMEPSLSDGTLIIRCCHKLPVSTKLDDVRTNDVQQNLLPLMHYLSISRSVFSNLSNREDVLAEFVPLLVFMS